MDYQRKSSGTTTTAVYRTWQVEMTEACISNTNEIANSLQIVHNTQGTNIPPFTG
jgi:hypothetical protein